MMLKDYHSALNDARRATTLNRLFTKGYHREAKCHIALGASSTALKCLERAKDLEPSNKQVEHDVGIFNFNRLMKVGGSNLSRKIKKSAVALPLTVGIKKTLYTRDYIHQQILLANCHENLTLPGGLFNFRSRESADLKIESTPPVTSNLLETLQGRSSGKYFQVCRKF